MAHPYAGLAKASQKRRLSALQANPGKGWGASKMEHKKSYPGTHAGSSTSMTIAGGKGKHRPDRYAAGGVVGKKRKPHATTNIIISHAGGRGGTGGGGGAGPPGGGPVPVPVNRPVPVPVPVGAGAGPMGPGGPAGPPPVTIRAPIAPPVGGPVGAPVGAAPIARPPMLPPGGPPAGLRPPGMNTGGSVKKAAKGGFLKDGPGKSYPGFPHSPTKKTKSTVSPLKDGGDVPELEDEAGGYKRGGRVSAAGIAVEEEGHGIRGRHAKGGEVGGFRRPGNLKALAERATYGGKHTPKGVKKRQMGGGMGAVPGAGGLGQGGGQAATAPPGGGGLMGLFPGRQPIGPQQGPPNVSGRPMIPPQALTVPMPRSGSSLPFARASAPGTTVGYKKGGVTKRASGGFVPKNQVSKDPGLEGPVYHREGRGFAAGGSVKAGSGSGIGRLARSGKGSKLPAKTEL